MQPSDRWYNQPDAIAILAQPDDHHAEELTARNDANMLRLQRLLDADVARICDELQDAIVGPVRIDHEALEQWYESQSDIPY